MMFLQFIYCFFERIIEGKNIDTSISALKAPTVKIQGLLILNHVIQFTSLV